MSRPRRDFSNNPGTHRRLPPSSARRARNPPRTGRAGAGHALFHSDRRAHAMRRVCSSIAGEASPIVQPSVAPVRSSPWFRASPGVRESAFFSPQAEAAAEGVGVVACARMRRQRMEFLDVAAPNHGFVGLERGDEALHDVVNVTAPFLLAVALQPAPTHVALIGALLVGQVTELHRLYDAVHNHGRSKPCSEAWKEHLAAVVAAQGLHGGVVDKYHGPTERGCKVEPDPSASQVIRFGHRPTVENRPGIADRYNVAVPVSGELLDFRYHSAGGQLRSGRKPSVLALSGGEDFH